MTTHYKTQAFVFRKNDINESDRVFSVFTDDFGRLDIFAKAIRKSVSKLRSGIDTFFMSEIEFIQGKSRKTLTDAVALEKFKNITRDLEKFEIANKISEVLDNLIKGQEKDKEIFSLVNETFARLDDYALAPKRPKGYPILIYYYFLWNALSLLGYKPEVEKCNVCRGKLNPYSVYFSDKAGGVICENCSGDKKMVNSDIVKILRLILKKEWQILSKLKVESDSQKLFQKISEDYYLYTLSSHCAKETSGSFFGENFSII